MSSPVTQPSTTLFFDARARAAAAQNTPGPRLSQGLSIRSNDDPFARPSISSFRGPPSTVWELSPSVEEEETENLTPHRTIRTERSSKTHLTTSSDVTAASVALAQILLPSADNSGWAELGYSTSSSRYRPRAASTGTLSRSPEAERTSPARGRRSPLPVWEEYRSGQAEASTSRHPSVCLEPPQNRDQQADKSGKGRLAIPEPVIGTPDSVPSSSSSSFIFVESTYTTADEAEAASLNSSRPSVQSHRQRDLEEAVAPSASRPAQANYNGPMYNLLYQTVNEAMRSRTTLNSDA